MFEITEHLEEIDKMIGLTNIKEEIVNLIIHLLLSKTTTTITNKTTTQKIFFVSYNKYIYISWC